MRDAAPKNASGQYSWWLADHSPKQLKMNACYGAGSFQLSGLGGCGMRVLCREQRTEQLKQRIGRTKAPGRARLRTRRCDLVGDRRRTHAEVRDLLAEFRDGCAALKKASLLNRLVDPTSLARRRRALLAFIGGIGMGRLVMLPEESQPHRPGSRGQGRGRHLLSGQLTTALNSWITNVFRAAFSR